MVASASIESGGEALQLFELDQDAERFEDPLRTAFARFAGPEDPPGDRPALRAVRLVRALGFRDMEVRLEPFTVLVGANNSGKSSLLRLIRFAYSLILAHVDRVDVTAAHLSKGRNLDDSLLPVAEVRDLWFGGVRREANTHLLAEIELEFDELALRFGLKSPFGHATSRVLSDQLDLPRDFWDRLTAFPIVYVPSSVGVVAHEEYRTPVRVDALIAGGHVHEVLRNLLLSVSQKGRLDLLGDLLANYFPGGLGGIRFDEAVDQYITATYSGDADHDLFNVGAGFLQVLQMLAFIVHQNPSVLLVDEPDAHLHSSLQRTTVDVLRGAAADLGMQVVMATHSKEIINYVDPEDLLVVDRAATSLSTLAPHESAITILEGLGSIDAVDAYFVLRNKRVLLVEGKTDIKVLHGFGAKRDVTLFEGDHRVVAIPTTGDSTATARSDLAILEAMIGSSIESLQIRDRDARLRAHLEAEEASAARPLHVLRRGSIETYLIVPAAIARVINDALDKDSPVSEAEVNTIVLDAAETLRDETFDRVASRFRTTAQRLEDRYVDVAEANSVARDVLADRESFIEHVDGKALLAAVRRAVQERYGVTFGNQRLIDEITEQEVDDEIWDVLMRIQALTT